MSLTSPAEFRCCFHEILPFDFEIDCVASIGSIALTALAARDGHVRRGSFLAERFGLVGAFPGEARPGAAEVAVGRRRAVNRPAQVERFDDALRRELEVRANQFGDLRVRESCRCRTYRPSRKPARPRRSRRRAALPPSWPAPRPRYSSRRSAPCSRPSGPPWSDPCRKARRRRDGCSRRRCPR